jgi:hypothetical protein
MDSMADLVAALAAVPDQDLRLLRTAVDGDPPIVTSLSTWLKAATDWEINRRAGAGFGLPDPRAAIGGSDTESSLVALAILFSRFRRVAPVAHFLDTTATLLCADTRGPSKTVH